MFLRVSFAIGLSLTSAAALANPPAQQDAKYWLAALKDPGLRDEAVCALLSSGQSVTSQYKYYEHVPDYGCRVRQVIDNLGHSDGTALVFLGVESRYYKLMDGSPGGHYVLFDAEGRGVPPFQNNNLLRDPDGVVDYLGDRSMAIVQQTSYGTDEGWSVEGLYVVPATAAQVPVLGILLGARPGKKGGKPVPPWSWRAVDLDGDGRLEFEIGPKVGADMIVRATYRYSPTSGRYEGPSGSLEGDFFLLPDFDPEQRWPRVQAFVTAHKLSGDCGKNCTDQTSSRKGPGIDTIEDMRRRFEAAREARDYPAMDAVVQEVRLAASPRVQSTLNEEVARYWVMDRGRCNLDFMPPDKVDFYQHYNVWITEALLICEAVKQVEAGNGGERAIMGKLFDAREKSFVVSRSFLYDAYARQVTINKKALALLAEYGLNDLWFDGDRESALIEQVRAGRADNVRVLLESGYDANLGVAQKWQFVNPVEGETAPFLPLPILPLQAAREALASQGERGLDVAAVLLEHGANPNRLAWYPHYAVYAKADPKLQARLDARIALAAKRSPASSAEFLGYLLEPGPDGESIYARFLVGNGSSKPVSISAWTDGTDFLLGGLDWESHLESKMPVGSRWSRSLVIEHGSSPSTRLVIQPGESHEVLYEMGFYSVINGQEKLQYRLWINQYPDAIYSEPFRMHDMRYPVNFTSREEVRDWDRPN